LLTIAINRLALNDARYNWAICEASNCIIASTVPLNQALASREVITCTLGENSGWKKTMILYVIHANVPFCLNAAGVGGAVNLISDPKALRYGAADRISNVAVFNDFDANQCNGFYRAPPPPPRAGETPVSTLDTVNTVIQGVAATAAVLGLVTKAG
jgi:hypothetical protein